MEKFGVIFDCDGTLVDSLGDAMASFNFALDRLGESPRSPEEIKRHFGMSADRILTNVLGSAEKGLQAFRYYKDHQTELAPRIRLHVGIEALLLKLVEHQIPLAIVTGRHAEDLAIILEPHGISRHFVTLIADSQLPKSKPAPDGILLAASRMGLPPGRTMYVGDSIVDIQAARAAGAKSVAALWDKQAKPEEMNRENPDESALHPEDVWRCFEKFTSLS